MPGKRSDGHPTGEGTPSEEGRVLAWLCWACKGSLQSFSRAVPVFVLQSLCFLCLPCGHLMWYSWLVAAMTGNLALAGWQTSPLCWVTEQAWPLTGSLVYSLPRSVYKFVPSGNLAFATQSRKSGCVLWTHSGHWNWSTCPVHLCPWYDSQGWHNERVRSCYFRRPPVN